MNKRFNIVRVITSNHDKLYFGGLILLAFSMPLSPFAVSVSQFVLVGNWLVERNFKQKWNQFKSQPALLIFISVFVIHLIGLFYSSDLDYGLYDVKKKLPLLGIPIIIATSEKLTQNKLGIVLIGFVAGVFGGTLISYGAYFGMFGFEYIDIREISIFISHIRFSLYIVLAISILLFSIDHLKNKRHKIFALILILWFHYFLFILQAYTGVVLIALVDIIFVFSILLKRLPKFIGVSGGVIIILFLIGFSYYHVHDILNILEVKEVLPTEKKVFTQYGNRYSFYTQEPITENGYHIYWYISREEIDTAWAKRSDIPLLEKDEKGQTVYYTLLRYLSSKGLRKDSEGIQKLTNEDIINIENGIANYLYLEFDPIKRRTFQILWEITNYLKGGNPNNHSVTQRFEFFKAGYSIFKNNFWFGVGTGDVRDAYKNYYSSSDTRLDKEKQLRAHNQYLTFLLTFGIFIGTWIVAALFLPLIIERKNINLLVVVFFIIVFLSMLAEDTLETQAGVTFFSYFYSLFLFGRTENRNELFE